MPIVLKSVSLNHLSPKVMSRLVLGLLYLLASIAQSVQRLDTGWTVRESNPGGSETFLHPSRRAMDLLSLLHNGYRVFPGSKVVEAWL